ncbi:MAG: hypothetical protein KF678_14715 [Phycisphaeraceae bacterium]|nr:hypothetical protein [Phycisphaeraceae bacterium]
MTAVAPPPAPPDPVAPPAVRPVQPVAPAPPRPAIVEPKPREAPAGEAAPPVPAPGHAEVTQAIVNDPAVKKAMEVFNARIIHVEPRRR